MQNRFINIWQRVKAIFGKDQTESRMESRVEEVWEVWYRDISLINFCEIFANRLTNYTLDHADATANDEAVNDCLQDCMCMAPKWVQMAYGIGRVYLIPYIMNNKIYTDIIPQSRVEILRVNGNDPVAIAVLADTRTKNEKWYDRWTMYDYDENAHTFVITTKATERNGSSEIPLTIFDDWATIPPVATITGVDRPLYGVIDSPKDNRQADMTQGAAITFGCEDTIKEIRTTLIQYAKEFELKKAFIGVDSIMLDPDTGKVPDIFKTFDGKSTENMFEVYSPDIRNQAYKDRLLELFSLLEKQVGTSSGILTPADANIGTATQVRRGAYDTIALVNKARKSIMKGLNDCCYAYDIYLRVLGIPHATTYTVKYTFKDSMLSDENEQFQKLIQAENAGIVSKVEIRRFLYPEETKEEAEQAIANIEASRPKSEFDPAMVFGE